MIGAALLPLFRLEDRVQRLLPVPENADEHDPVWIVLVEAKDWQVQGRATRRAVASRE